MQGTEHELSRTGVGLYMVVRLGLALRGSALARKHASLQASKPTLP